MFIERHSATDSCAKSRHTPKRSWKPRGPCAWIVRTVTEREVVCTNDVDCTRAQPRVFAEARTSTATVLWSRVAVPIGSLLRLGYLRNVTSSPGSHSTGWPVGDDERSQVMIRGAGGTRRRLPSSSSGVQAARIGWT